ncbi:translation initiation factor IF-3 [Nitrospira defluvii]|nr:translation initiation factor IF-3 [Nitrospira defluvii]
MPPRYKDRTPSTPKMKVNRLIRANEVRVIGAEGEQLGIMSSSDALDIAKQQGLDLVEVAPNANPSVCRVMDYGKYKYEQSRKERGLKASQKGGHLKEVKLRPYTGEHDLEFKINHAKEFLEGRNKVKITLMFRGREMAYKQRGWEMMSQIQKQLEEVGQPEYSPKMEGRNMIMILAPKASKGTP